MLIRFLCADFSDQFACVMCDTFHGEHMVDHMLKL